MSKPGGAPEIKKYMVSAARFCIPGEERARLPHCVPVIHVLKATPANYGRIPRNGHAILKRGKKRIDEGRNIFRCKLS